MADAGQDEQDHVRLRLDPFDITARARSAYGPDGRLALPHTARWPIFPFETDNLRVRHLEDPVLPEPPRRDETVDDCSTCSSGDDRFVWNDERWRVSMSNEPLSLPAVVLHSRDHVDFHALTDQMAAEMGVRLIRIQRALAGIEGVGRVHVYKWGDGGTHLHIFVVARPLGMMQLRGMFLTTWLHTLPPLSPELWTAIRSHVTSTLDTRS
jgi:diadenosine tetraphosphate (Ap4A) HIT family hydrolase